MPKKEVRDQMYFDKNKGPIKKKINTLLKDINLGLRDSYLMWNFENYQSVKAQIQMGQMICNPPVINPMPVVKVGEK